MKYFDYIKVMYIICIKCFDLQYIYFVFFLQVFFFLEDCLQFIVGKYYFKLIVDDV